MAEVQDVEVLEATGEIGELETVEQQDEQQKTQELNLEGIKNPTRYQGKSIEDIIKMHQEAEKLIDRQSREVGEVRKLADELIKSQLQQKAVPEEKQQEVDFFENPQEAIRLAVENNPKVKAAEQYALQIQRQQALQQLSQLHPDFQSVVQDGEFATWVQSNRVRQQLFQQAEAYDVDAANELLSTYKLLKATRQKTVNETESKARSQTLKNATIDVGGSGESGKRTFKRAELINLRIRDPQRFALMEEEINRAYQEGRVR